MKIYKDILLIGLLFVINDVNTRGMGGVEQKRQTDVPVQQQIQIPSQARSYPDALHVIRTKLRPSDILNNNLSFTPNFINFVKNSAQADIFAKALFEAGANFAVVFTNDDMINNTIIRDIEDNIDRQMNILFPQSSVKITQPSVLQPQLVQKSLSAQMHLVPTDASIMQNFKLCPLFGQKQHILNEDEKQLAQQLRKEGSSEEDIMNLFGQIPPHYSAFDENYVMRSGDKRPQFVNRNVSMNAPCVVNLGRFGNWNRKLMQVKTLDQFELAEQTNLSPAMCGGLSLNNGRLIRQYALTGKSEILQTTLHDIQDAAKFLVNVGIEDWLTAEIVRENLTKLAPVLGKDGIDVSAISTASLFDTDLAKNNYGFGALDKSEFDYVQMVKRNIQDGLKRDNYLHIMILGNEETVEGQRGHYFCFAIIKVGNEIEYVVLDTIPSAYHLQDKSHERDRLMLIVDNIEQGRSNIKITNVRIRGLQAFEAERLKQLQK